VDKFVGGVVGIMLFGGLAAGVIGADPVLSGGIASFFYWVWHLILLGVSLTLGIWGARGLAQQGTLLPADDDVTRHVIAYAAMAAAALILFLSWPILALLILAASAALGVLWYYNHGHHNLPALRAHAEQVLRDHPVLTEQQFIAAFSAEYEKWRLEPPDELMLSIARSIYRHQDIEPVVFPTPPLFDFSFTPPDYRLQYSHLEHEIIQKAADVDLLLSATCDALPGYKGYLEKFVPSEPTPFTVQLAHSGVDLRTLVAGISTIFLDTDLCDRPSGIAPYMAEIVNRRSRAALSQRAYESGERIGIYEDKSIPASQLASTYLPEYMQPLFNTTLPFAIPQEKRFQGMYVVAPSGRGKTTGLRHLLLRIWNS
jgi:hypothetical protein